jgi:Flp pilus assembly protein protease CpaA
MMVLNCAVPRFVARMFASDAKYLEWAAIELPVPLIVNALLQSLRLGGLTTVFTFFTQTAALPAAMAILFCTDENDLGRLNYTSPIQQGFTALVAIPFRSWPIWRIAKQPGNADREAQMLEFEESESEKETLVMDELPEG